MSIFKGYREEKMKFEDIQKLMQVLEKSKLKKMVIKQDDFELHLEKPSESVSEPIQVQTAQPKVEMKVGPAPVAEASQEVIESPMVGTFYSSPSPDQASFVKVGDKVDENTVVCIVEAMKVMNEVKAGKSGTISEILVDNADPVEYGTPLFRIV